MEGLSYTTDDKKRKRRRRGKEFPSPNLQTPANLHGIIPRAIHAVFANAHKRQVEGEKRPSPHPTAPRENSPPKENFTYSITCSYYQIYNETITDLLRPQRKPNAGRPSGAANLGGKPGPQDKGLRIRWHPDNTFRVENLYLYRCETPEEMRDAFFSGVREKVVCSHLLNESSSRSHCIFTIYVECQRAQTREVVRRSELSLVDLAGSERLSMLSRDPSQSFLKESIDINTSLLALGKVITSLAEASKKRGAGEGSGEARRGQAHIPYRDSKLTKLLQHALGGNSITVMIACISRSDRYIDESISTMLYTGRARNIENVPHVNQDAAATQLTQLRGQIASLKEELRYYRDLTLDHLAPLSNKPPNANDPDAAINEESEKEAPGEMDKLATSLIDACAMLQQIIKVNHQLRNAYDEATKAVEAGERRETELNAENLALRERLAMLESIALNEAFLDIKTVEDDSEETTGDALGAAKKIEHARQAPSNRPCNTYEPYWDSADNVSGPGGSLSRLKFPLLESKAAAEGWCSHREAPKTKLGSSLTDNNSINEVKCAKLEFNKRYKDINAPEDFYSKGENIMTNKLNEVATFRIKDAAHYTPTRSDEEPPTVTTSLENYETKRGKDLFDKPSHLCEDEKALKADKKAINHARKKEKRLKRVLAKKLEEYENFYRPRAFFEPYGSIPTGSSSTGLSSASRNSTNPLPSHKNKLNPSMPWGRDDIAACKAIRETKTILRKESPEVSKAFIPRSTYCMSSYGALDFGGEKEDVEKFEAERQESKSKLMELLARREELQTGLQNDIYGRVLLSEKGKMRPNGKDGGGENFPMSALLHKLEVLPTRTADKSPSSPAAEVRQSDAKIHSTGKYYANGDSLSPYGTCESLRRLPKCSKKCTSNSVDRLLKYLDSDKVL
ncbi:unnamed protein product [Phytomonas sp. Hart1]|nr:unnamed protein product [Phytomonas sp. Hart1]|eukprot:CCW66587.1 unnamed protein product [Phytomonas sp. isolate Hart1]